MAAFASSINSVFQSEEIEAHLRPGLGIANGVSPMVRHEFAQFNHDIPKFGAISDIGLRTVTAKVYKRVTFRLL